MGPADDDEPMDGVGGLLEVVVVLPVDAEGADAQPTRTVAIAMVAETKSLRLWRSC